MTKNEIERKIMELGIEIYAADPTKVNATKMPRDKKQNLAAREFIMSNKPAIMAVLIEQKERAERIAAFKERTGYYYLEKLSKAWSKYEYAYEKAWEREEICRVDRPKERMDEARKRYPEAAAYRDLIWMSYSENIDEAEIGREGVRRVEDGENAIKVLEEAERSWNRAATRLVKNM